MDGSKSLPIDLTFTVTVAPDRVQSHSVLYITYTPDYTTIKYIFAAKGAHMQVLSAATPSSIDTITIEVPKSQVSMLAKKGGTLIDQGVNSYSMNSLTL